VLKLGVFFNQQLKLTSIQKKSSNLNHKLFQYRQADPKIKQTRRAYFIILVIFWPLLIVFHPTMMCFLVATLQANVKGRAVATAGTMPRAPDHRASHSHASL